MNVIYIVSRMKRDVETIYGPAHGSKDAYTTLCGYEIDDGKWCITDNRMNVDLITCKKWLKTINHYR